MTSEEIKAAREEQELLLKEAQECLKELRAMCPHKNTFEGNWSWRLGSIQPAVICSDCGALVAYTVPKPNFPDFLQPNKTD